MMGFRRYQTLRVLRRHPIPDRRWRRVSDRLPLLAPLSAAERARLRQLATLFLHDKRFSGAQGLEVTPEMTLTVAAQACLEVLELGLDAFAGWSEIVLYPAAFRVRHEQVDEIGLVTAGERMLSGESWSHGPVILAWDEVERDSLEPVPGRNVVIHEFAHKLDMLNGRANGMPPLHPQMPIEQWTEALSRAYAALVRALERGHHTPIDAYAATDPAEFFAVVCEYFFTAPQLLHHHEPEVYRQLRAYFLQDPLERIGHGP